MAEEGVSEARASGQDFEACVRAAIAEDASGQVQAQKERNARRGVVLDHTLKVRLTTQRLNGIGQECSDTAKLAERHENFKKYKVNQPKVAEQMVNRWATRVCEKESDKLDAAQRQKMETEPAEPSLTEGTYERVTAADLADPVEEADEGGEAYVIECNALPEEPKVPEFQKKLGRMTLNAVQEAVATREKNKDSSRVSVGGVLVLTLQVKPDGKVSVVGIESRNGFKFSGNMSTIRAELNNRLRGMKVDSLPVGNRTYVVDFNSTADTTPQRPPVAVPMTS